MRTGVQRAAERKRYARALTARIRLANPQPAAFPANVRPPHLQLNPRHQLVYRRPAEQAQTAQVGELGSLKPSAGRTRETNRGRPPRAGSAGSEVGDVATASQRSDDGGELPWLGEWRDVHLAPMQVDEQRAIRLHGRHLGRLELAVPSLNRYCLPRAEGRRCAAFPVTLPGRLPQTQHVQFASPHLDCPGAGVEYDRNGAASIGYVQRALHFAHFRDVPCAYLDASVLGLNREG